MHRVIPISICALVLGCGLALADPGISVQYLEGIMRVRLEGSYPGSYYRVWRSDQLLGEAQPFADAEVLCTGDCIVHDPDYVPGRTYFYRFDVREPGVGFTSYGPYAVTVPGAPLGARAWPNPGADAMRIELTIPGGRREAPLEITARILDLQGRVVRTLHRGVLPRGLTTLSWDGNGDGGRRPGSGIYFLRVTSPLGATTLRVVRLR